MFLLFSLFASAQKDTSQQIDSKGIESIHINTDEAFKINLKTTKGDMILISTHTEGEYFNDIALITETKGGSLHLSTKFREILQSGYDKLSAHKVFSLEIRIEIPENLQVLIKSNIASLEAKGVYDFLEAELNSGYCTLTNFKGNALINTYNGPISIETTNATVTASSRNGEVIIPLNFTGNHIIKVTSINGDIRVTEN
ncbi:MAG TPA: hypothetical protein VK833_07095 [Gillisia sp.]|nr:hypothetical protein [Gillisia sp.]